MPENTLTKVLDFVFKSLLFPSWNSIQYFLFTSDQSKSMDTGARKSQKLQWKCEEKNKEMCWPKPHQVWEPVNEMLRKIQWTTDSIRSVDQTLISAALRRELVAKIHYHPVYRHRRDSNLPYPKLSLLLARNAARPPPTHSPLWKMGHQKTEE